MCVPQVKVSTLAKLWFEHDRPSLQNQLAHCQVEIGPAIKECNSGHVKRQHPTGPNQPLSAANSSALLRNHGDTPALHSGQGSHLQVNPTVVTLLNGLSPYLLITINHKSKSKQNQCVELQPKQ